MILLLPQFVRVGCSIVRHDFVPCPQQRRIRIRRLECADVHRLVAHPDVFPVVVRTEGDPPAFHPHPVAVYGWIGSAIVYMESDQGTAGSAIVCLNVCLRVYRHRYLAVVPETRIGPCPCRRHFHGRIKVHPVREQIVKDGLFASRRSQFSLQPG